MRIVVAKRPLAINIENPFRWVFKQTTHGPQKWPWWRFFTISCVDVTMVCKPSSGLHIWIYTRWGAICWGWYFDRRTPEQKGIQS